MMFERLRVGRTTILGSLRRKRPRFNRVALQLANLVQNTNLDVALSYQLRWSLNLEDTSYFGI